MVIGCLQPSYIWPCFRKRYTVTTAVFLQMSDRVLSLLHKGDNEGHRILRLISVRQSVDLFHQYLIWRQAATPVIVASAAFNSPFVSLRLLKTGWFYISAMRPRETKITYSLNSENIIRRRQLRQKVKKDRMGHCRCIIPRHMAQGTRKYR